MRVPPSLRVSNAPSIPTGCYRPMNAGGERRTSELLTSLGWLV
jgi:hypothetical protein